MKISGIDTIFVDAGWRAWVYVKVTTDEGLVGYGESTDNFNYRSVAGAVADLSTILVGRDPRQIELLNREMYRRLIMSEGGASQQAIGGIDLALWDIKAKALGVPVYELLGGPTRDRVRLYWSQCVNARAAFGRILGTPPIRTWDDVADVGREVVRRGYTALKCSIAFPGEPPRVYMPGFGGDPLNADLNVPSGMLRHIETQIGTLRDAVGPDVEIAMDLNFNFRASGFAQIAKLLEPFNLMWVEFDIFDPAALAQIKQSTTSPICSLESLYLARNYKPYLDLHAVDVAMVDVVRNGLTESKKIANLVDLYQINVTPHNYYSHLSTLIGAHFAAVVPNVRILEEVVDDVPWKADLLTAPLEIENGYLKLPAKPGWGADLDEEVAAAHPWQPATKAPWWVSS